MKIRCTVLTVGLFFLNYFCPTAYAGKCDDEIWGKTIDYRDLRKSRGPFDVDLDDHLIAAGNFQQSQFGDPSSVPYHIIKLGPVTWYNATEYQDDFSDRTQHQALELLALDIVKQVGNTEIPAQPSGHESFAYPRGLLMAPVLPFMVFNIVYVIGGGTLVSELIEAPVYSKQHREKLTYNLGQAPNQRKIIIYGLTKEDVKSKAFEKALTRALDDRKRC